MKIEQGKVILETQTCHMCGHNRLPQGMAPGPFVNGEPDWDNPRICDCCGGTGKVGEDRFSFMPEGMMKTIPIKLYLQDRNISFNESYIGIGCIWSCLDQGRAWEQIGKDQAGVNAFMREIRKEVDEDTSQASKITDENLNVCNHIAVIVNKGGYSLRAVFSEDASDLLNKASGELPEPIGIMFGIQVANNGENGTLAAATYNTKEN